MHLVSVEDSNTFGLWVTIDLRSFGITATAPFGRGGSSSNSLKTVNKNTNAIKLLTSEHTESFTLSNVQTIMTAAAWQPTGTVVPMKFVRSFHLFH